MVHAWKVVQYWKKQHKIQFEKTNPIRNHGQRGI